MNKAIRILLIVYPIIYFFAFALMVASGIVILATANDIIKQLMENYKELTVETAKAFIVPMAVAMFFGASVFLFAACTCLVSQAKINRGNLTFRSMLTIGIFNVIIGAQPAGVLLIVEAGVKRHHKEI